VSPSVLALPTTASSAANRSGASERMHAGDVAKVCGGWGMQTENCDGATDRPAQGNPAPVTAGPPAVTAAVGPRAHAKVGDTVLAGFAGSVNASMAGFAGGWPTAERAHRHSDGFQIGAGGLAPHARRGFDGAGASSPSRQRDDLLLLLFAQEVGIRRSQHGPCAASTSLRASNSLWPVLACPPRSAVAPPARQLGPGAFDALRDA
jgi:hypothetical protein